VVLDDDQLAQARDAGAAVGDAAGGRRDHRIADPALDIDALASRLGESGQDLALGRPDERDGLRVRLLFLRKDRDVVPGVWQAHRLRFAFRGALPAPLLLRRADSSPFDSSWASRRLALSAPRIR